MQIPSRWTCAEVQQRLYGCDAYKEADATLEAVRIIPFRLWIGQNCGHVTAEDGQQPACCSCNRMQHIKIYHIYQSIYCSIYSRYLAQSDRS